MGQLRLGFIGIGNMATAIIGGAVKSGQFLASEIGIFDINEEKLKDFTSRGFAAFSSIKELVCACDAVLISVKPQNFPQVLPEIKEGMSSDKLLISIAAGITADIIKNGVGCDCKLVLAMPNTPLLLGCGATALSLIPPATQQDFDFAKKIFASAGVAAQISPDKMKEIIPVNGSSPAFFYYFAKTIIESAVKMGIDAETAKLLVAQTMLGSARMLMESDKTPQELIDMVCSPGGATLAGMKALDDNGFTTAIAAASEACVKRASELAAQNSMPTPAEKPATFAEKEARPQSDRPWYEESAFYQIYPIGFCGAPLQNDGVLQNRIGKVSSWISHMLDTGVDAIYFSPVFESDSHGYDTRDYSKIDCRLGTNQDFAKVCTDLHSKGIHVVIDGVFNHVGRGFWAFQDLLKNRQDSQYRDWFYIDFNRNGNFNDGLWYEGWEGHFELVKLNLDNPKVREHLFGCIRGWIDEFNIDGLRLDVAYMLNQNFMRELHVFVKGIRQDFFLLGEAIHGDYNRIVNDEMLDSCTNYECYKGIYSSLNDRNMFEIAHSLNRQFGPEQWTSYKGKHLFNFVDNHDVSRIASVLKDDRHLMPAYGLMFGMPGIPCVYYGSEWGATGEKIKGADDAPLRPCFDEPRENPLTQRIADFSYIRSHNLALCHGSYRQVYITNLQLVFEREYNGNRVLVAINADSQLHTTKVLPTSGKMFDLTRGDYIEFGGALTLAPYSCTFLRCD